MILGLAGGRASPASAAGGCAVAPGSLDAEEQAFVALLNTYRAQQGLGTLKVAPALSQAARWMSNDLATKKYFDHADSLGRLPAVRTVDCGYPGPSGENLAAGTILDTAAKALDAWKGSPGHNQNMLFRDYRVVGVARRYDAASPYGWYWVADFGTDDVGSTTPLGQVAAATPWVNDLRYGSAGGGFYWDTASGRVWTGERGWHLFSPNPARPVAALWVNDLQYGSTGGGFYWDPVSNEVWTAERGWHGYSPRPGVPR